MSCRRTRLCHRLPFAIAPVFSDTHGRIPLSFEQIWAPWRLGYIKGEKTSPAPSVEQHWLPGSDHDCFLCRNVAEDRDAENLVVAHGKHTVIVLNRYPYNNGHLLVAPRHHKARLQELSADEHLECMQKITQMAGLIERLMNPEGFNIGLNLGRVAGAGLPGHLHWHIVPRWNGDTNFMPVLAGVNVIPQSLEAVRDMLASPMESEAK